MLNIPVIVKLNCLQVPYSILARPWFEFRMMRLDGQPIITLCDGFVCEDFAISNAVMQRFKLRVSVLGLAYFMGQNSALAV